MTNQGSAASVASQNVHVRKQVERKLKMQQERNIKQEPVCLPTPERLDKMRESRKQIQQFKLQSILYGVDVLSSEISTFYQT